MNRRNVLGLSALTALGIGLLPGNPVAQQAADMDGVKAASKAFYDALAVLDDGTAMAKVWAQKPYITYVSPSSTSVMVGWDAQKKSWPENNARYSKRSVALSDSQIHVNGNLAWEIGVETGQTQTKDGTIRPVDAIATNVYEKIDGRWLMVSHHAGAKPK